jgi:hypothetical protein
MLRPNYSNLIRSGSEVATVATGMALLAVKTKRDKKAQAEIDRFVAVVFPRFAELQARHPKWREVNLAASLPGFKRTAGAEAWLAAQAMQGQADCGKRLGSNPGHARDEQGPAGGVVQAVYRMAARKGALISAPEGNTERNEGLSSSLELARFGARARNRTGVTGRVPRAGTRAG